MTCDFKGERIRAKGERIRAKGERIRAKGERIRAKSESDFHLLLTFRVLF